MSEADTNSEVDAVPEVDAVAEVGAVPEADTNPEADAVPEAPSAAEPIYRVMNVESVTFNLGDVSPQVHLMENERPYRHLSVPIALPEAQALHAAMHHLNGRRPSTHELASSIIRQFQADIIAVRVTRHEAGVFYAVLDIMTPRGREGFDARPSDAFILALRQAVAAPILCDEEVLAQFFVS